MCTLVCGIARGSNIGQVLLEPKHHASGFPSTPAVRSGFHCKHYTEFLTLRVGFVRRARPCETLRLCRTMRRSKIFWLGPVSRSKPFSSPRPNATPPQGLKLRQFVGGRHTATTSAVFCFPSRLRFRLPVLTTLASQSATTKVQAARQTIGLIQTPLAAPNTNGGRDAALPALEPPAVMRNPP